MCLKAEGKLQLMLEPNTPGFTKEDIRLKQVMEGEGRQFGMRRDGSPTERKGIDDKKQPRFALRMWGENQGLAIFSHFDLYFSSLVENPQLHAYAKPHPPPWTQSLKLAFSLCF